MFKKSLVVFLLIICSCFSFPTFAAAQDQNNGPIYIIQPGDTLNSVAERFGISLNDLIEANGITDPNIISEGMRLVIPGLTGISGELTTINIPLGESLSSLAFRYQVPLDFLYKLNRITSPSEVYAGSSVIILVSDNQLKLNSTDQMDYSNALLDLAIIHNKNPWELAFSNDWIQSSTSIPSDFVLYRQESHEEVFSPISPLLQSIDFSPLPALQGSTTEIIIKTNEPLQLTGFLNGFPLNFVEMNENEYVALQGIHAMSQPGLIPFRLDYETFTGIKSSFEQSILLKSAGFGKDPPLSVAYETIDPEVTKPEEDQIRIIITNYGNEKLWDGKWLPPTPDFECIKSRYGNRRSYNGSDYIYFHTGVDFGVCVTPSLSIYAPANGVIVFTGPLTVRGNTTIIDHGMGVFSAYFHQAEIKVTTGDEVVAGQEIGVIGSTGRVTGPHLHWEIWVNGVQVEPMAWIENQYP